MAFVVHVRLLYRFAGVVAPRPGSQWFPVIKETLNSQGKDLSNFMPFR